MRFLILVLLTFSIQSAAWAGNLPTDFEGDYEVKNYTGQTGSWNHFWTSVDVTKLQSITLEKSGFYYYLNLVDTQGVKWSANYLVCAENSNRPCNARLAADGQSLEIEFFGDWKFFKIILGAEQGRLVWSDDQHVEKGTLTFGLLKK